MIEGTGGVWPNGTDAGSRPAQGLLRHIHRETLDLLIEARNYAAYKASADTPPGDVRALTVACESLRVTTRLAHVVAWLLVQRAVEAGELTPAEATAPHRRLGGRVVCTAPGGVDDVDLPEGLRGLLRRSQNLYERIARLDEMVARRRREAAEGGA